MCFIVSNQLRTRFTVTNFSADNLFKIFSHERPEEFESDEHGSKMNRIPTPTMLKIPVT